MKNWTRSRVLFAQFFIKQPLPHRFGEVHLLNFFKNIILTNFGNLDPPGSPLGTVGVSSRAHMSFRLVSPLLGKRSTRVQALYQVTSCCATLGGNSLRAQVHTRFDFLFSLSPPFSQEFIYFANLLDHISQNLMVKINLYYSMFIQEHVSFFLSCSDL